MNFLSKFLRNQFGFSMAQGLIGLGIVGGLALVVAQIGKQSSQNQKIASSSYAVVEATGQIQSLLSNHASCMASLGDYELKENETIDIKGIKRVDGSQGFALGQNILNNELTISKITFKRDPTNSILTFTFIKNAAQNNTTSKNISISRDFIINAVWDSENKMINCASDVSNFIDTVAELALLKACPVDPNDPSQRRFLPDNSLAPASCQALLQLVDPTNNLTCPVGQIYGGFEWINGRYKPVCKIALDQECTENQLLRKNANGSLECVDVSCPANALALGLGSDGKMKCLSCSAGKIPVFVTKAGKTQATKTKFGKSFAMMANTSDVECVNPVCSDKSTVITGLQADGNPLCEKFIDPSACGGNGGRVTMVNGELTIECCTPTCTDANQCAGTPYDSSNSCGSCMGTKPSKDETFTWNDTTTYRVKPGAVCTSGLIARERLRNKVCNGDAVCGGVTCTPGSEWVDAGTEACATACNEGQVQGGPLISHNQNNAYCGGNLTGDMWVYKSQKCISGNWVDQPGIQLYYRSQALCNANSPKPAAPTRTPSYFGTQDPCSSPEKTAYTEVTNANGTFSFCKWRFLGGGGGCFVAGTQITLHDGQKKNIEDILVGDELLDGSHKKVTVKKLLRIQHDGDIVSINGGGYFFTPNHPFLTTAGWKSLDPNASNLETPGLNVTLLKVGDILIKRSGIELVITLDSIPTSEKVYNFELDGSHEYIADEYVVHNKLEPEDIPGEPGGP